QILCADCLFASFAARQKKALAAAIAPIAATSFCSASLADKRYSGKRESAPKVKIQTLIEF
ncbi:MAG TPA: hypothetical protein PLI38_12280, partial [Flavobacterium sp.]|nr:hypothetical protein [Flavobacterium sp.]